MQDYKMYIAGTFTDSNNSFEVINPYTDKPFAKTYLADENDLETAIQKAELVFGKLKDMPTYKRSSILMDIAHKIMAQKQELALLLTQESGKPIKYALGEIDRAITTFLVAAEECKRIPKEYIDLDWTAAGINKEGLIAYFPVGLVAGIAPFNFPMNLAVHKIAPAIAAGCPIILKPATSTPLSTLALAKIIDQTELPKGAISIMPMNRQTGNLLVTDERFKLLTFTGSPEVGWKMKQQCGKKKIVLELGGNAGVIVTETADIEKAVQKCLVGAFAFSGQVCIHAQRIYVQQSIFNEFLEQFAKKTVQLVQGNPENTETDISVMIDEPNAIRIEEWVNEAISGGAKLVCGGKRENGYYQPTILTNTDNSMKVCFKEAFAPVVVVEPYVDFKQAIEQVNDSNYGLQAGVFTNLVSEMNAAFRNIETGGVVINDIPTFRVDHMPYGGIKDSGLGREGVKYAMHDMLEPKLLVKDKR